MPSPARPVITEVRQRTDQTEIPVQYGTDPFRPKAAYPVRANMNITRNIIKPIGTLLLITSSLLVVSGCDKPPSVTPAPYTTETVPVEPSDLALTADVKAALLEAPEINMFDIAVESTKGDVKLTGLLGTQAQIDETVRLVKLVNGVKAVHNELAIKQ